MKCFQRFVDSSEYSSVAFLLFSVTLVNCGNKKGLKQI